MTKANYFETFFFQISCTNFSSTQLCMRIVFNILNNIVIKTCFIIAQLFPDNVLESSPQLICISINCYDCAHPGSLPKPSQTSLTEYRGFQKKITMMVSMLGQPQLGYLLLKKVFSSKKFLMYVYVLCTIFNDTFDFSSSVVTYCYKLN